MAVGHVAEKIRLGTKARAPARRHGVGEPETRVVARARIARAWIAESYE
jgi:hypothetical protein